MEQAEAFYASYEALFSTFFFFFGTSLGPARDQYLVVTYGRVAKPRNQQASSVEMCTRRARVPCPLSAPLYPGATFLVNSVTTHCKGGLRFNTLRAVTLSPDIRERRR